MAGETRAPRATEEEAEASLSPPAAAVKPRAEEGGSGEGTGRRLPLTRAGSPDTTQGASPLVAVRVCVCARALMGVMIGRWGAEDKQEVPR